MKLKSLWWGINIKTMVEHQMNLNDKAFSNIKDGTKILEVRLYDEKRQKLEIGDKITFFNNGQGVAVMVFGLSRFASFSDLFNTLGGLTAGWSEKDTPDFMVNGMRKFFSEEEERKYGVLGIHIRLI